MIEKILAASKKVDLAQTKYAIALTFIAVPFISQAAPSDMGTFKITSTTATSASGTYETSNKAKGSFTLIRNERVGYTNRVDFTPSAGNSGINGIEARNNQDLSVSNDKFKYTFTIIPNDNSSIHTIKIGQASYANDGNSEIARQTLEYAPNPKLTSVSTQAFIKNNTSVDYYYDAMGDYFMGRRLTDTQLISQDPSAETVGGPQLRQDSSNSTGSGLYYYKISNLKDSGSSNPYSPYLNKNKEVSLNPGTGSLPENPTFEKIFKKLANNDSYAALANTTISNVSKYVSYGIENSKSSYVVAVKNASSVTLTYEGIMKGNAGVSGPIIGETYNEWISFGVESTPNYVFSGTVFNDNGGLTLEPNKVGTVNSAYFNGEFDPTAGEAVISNSNVTVSLTDCSLENNLIANTSPQLVSSVTGKYNFYIPKDSLAVGQTVCLVENEPAEWEYSVDTTTNKRKVIITPDKYTYDNLDFGEVKVNNTALVLIKSQYVHDCNATLDYSDSAINQTNDNPRIGFSDQPVSDVAPNQCIAYRIEAYNRGHVELNDVQIRDELTSNKSSFTNPTPKGVPTNIYGTTMPTAKVITSNTFNLAASAGSSTKATLYFNTKYRTTVNP